ncbi:MAG TPA: hypothetical protein VKA84_14495 [Gemmatimonadaceae bacterium]|nr:hypothetical protein [Gemmatimonadaceae bacterium]
MNNQQARTLQETTTTLSPAAVLASAKTFFQRRNTIYSAFLEKEGPTYLTFRGQGGEELVIAVRQVEGGTGVTGSTYMFDQQIARFFATLPPAPVAQPVAQSTMTPVSTGARPDSAANAPDQSAGTKAVAAAGATA